MKVGQLGFKHGTKSKHMGMSQTEVSVFPLKVSYFGTKNGHLILKHIHMEKEVTFITFRYVESLSIKIRDDFTTPLGNSAIGNKIIKKKTKQTTKQRKKWHYSKILFVSKPVFQNV